LCDWCGRGDLNPHALAGAATSRLCVCQFRHFRKPGALLRFYFFAGAGAAGAAGFGATGAAGTEPFTGWRSSTVLLLAPALFVAMIDSDIDVSMNSTIDTVVAFDSSVAEPRGPNAV
jgi:hypothetical protein